MGASLRRQDALDACVFAARPDTLPLGAGENPRRPSVPDRRSCSRSANIGGCPARASDENQKAKPSRGGSP